MPTLTKIKYRLTFEPDEIDVRLQHFTVGKVMKLIENEKLEIAEENDLQRLPDIWDDKRKSLLVESLMIRLPLPLFYFDGSEQPWTVIDGLQRLNTLFQFISKKSPKTFVLKQLQYLGNEYKNFSFDELPLFLRQRILESPIEAFVVNPGTPYDVKYNIFHRINTLGLRLTGQEIRNSSYKGTPARFTKSLAIEEAFIRATNGKISSKRMEDREYATRFLAFYWFKDDYFSDMDEFLRITMENLYNVKEEEETNLRNLFVEAMNRASELLGTFCFYRINPDGKQKGHKPNKALFDTLSWNISKLSKNDFSHLLQNKTAFRKSYIKFMNDEKDFHNAINDTTASTKAVVNRFTLLEKFIKEQL